jgi:predicted ATPase
MTLEQRKQRMLKALLLQIQTLTRQNPVLIILEDAHWVDPASLEVFGRIVDRIPFLRTLLIVRFRPEFDAPWLGSSHVTAEPKSGDPVCPSL